MKIRHRIPPEAHFVSDHVTPEYQAQVDRSLARAQAREAAAIRHLEAAQSRLVKAERIRSAAQRSRAVLVARELVELRRQELLDLQRQINGAPSAASHRGIGHGSRPVPGMKVI